MVTDLGTESSQRLQSTMRLCWQLFHRVLTLSVGGGSGDQSGHNEHQSQLKYFSVCYLASNHYRSDHAWLALFSGPLAEWGPCIALLPFPPMAFSYVPPPPPFHYPLASLSELLCSRPT